MNRRHFLKHMAAYSALALPGLEFARTIHANAQQLRRNNKTVIILWMGGGPASIDIWDLKPGTNTGGPFTGMETAVPGIRISEHMPKVASQMHNLAIIRSLTTTEGDHTRLILQEKLTSLSEKHGFKITSLGRGLSTGSELEYVDPDTIHEALGSRR